MSQIGEETTVRWAFLNKYVKVRMLGDKVAYSLTCEPQGTHTHTIECLWVWHDCDLSLAPEQRANSARLGIEYGWTPTGVSAHDLINIEPLHIEASVYWPACCGMHGWIRDGKWIDA